MRLNWRLCAVVVLLLVQLAIIVLPSVSGACPNGCSNRGICLQNSRCQCLEGYAGTNCSRRGTRSPSIYDCTNCWRFLVGSPEYHSGPSLRLPDSQLVSLNLNGVLNTYLVGNGNAELQSSGASASDYLKSPIVGLSPNQEYNTTGQFDSCGSWLSRALVDDASGKVIGLYHAETGCNYEIGQTLKAMGYAESIDGGRTWTKPNYPNNVLLSFNGTLVPGQGAGLGDGTMIKFTDPADGREYYYIYYTKWTDQSYTAVARSPVESGGAPGTWYKYNSGWPSQPNGNGGPESPIPNTNDATVYVHAPSGEILTVGNDYSGGHGGGGAQMSVSKDGLTFQYMPEPLYMSSDWRVYGWGNGPKQQEKVDITSFLGETGGYLIGNTFWLYYLYLKPGQGMNARYMLRRKVTMTYNKDASLTNNGVALTQYVHRKTGERYETREWVPPNQYTPRRILGYMMTKEHTGTFGIASCRSGDDYYVARVGMECVDANDEQLEALGWIYAFRRPNTTAIYRCQGLKDTFLSWDRMCDGQDATPGLPFGYLLQGPPLTDDLGTADVVVPRADSWSFMPSSSSLSSNWTLSSFNDSIWAVGIAPFASGYPVSAPSPFTAKDHYFRRQFRLDPSRTAVKALLTLGSDDRSTAWINGQMVDDDRTVRFWANQAEVWNRRVWLDVSVLRQGAGGQANVIAVHVPNGDSWAYFDAQLTVFYSDNTDVACPANCGPHGNCVDGACVCDPQWGALDCSVPLCTYGPHVILSTVINEGDMWKYSSTGVFNPDSVVSWVLPMYNDAAWDQAATPVGAGYTNAWKQRTTLPYNPGTTTGKDPYSYMFRKTVTLTVPDGYTIASGVMGISSDDYHLAYVNGFLVDGSLHPYTSRQARRWNSVVNINPEMLFDGNNVISVRVPNWYTSEWLYFNLQLNVTYQAIKCLDTCPPATSCIAERRNCGRIYNGCEYVSCGTCGSGRVCSDQGQCQCTPQTSCAARNFTCGTMYDGCLNVNCGACLLGHACSREGRCVCVPSVTCASLNKTCGEVYDGCKLIDCGVCSAPTTSTSIPAPTSTSSSSPDTSKPPLNLQGSSGERLAVGILLPVMLLCVLIYSSVHL